MKMSSCNHIDALQSDLPSGNDPTVIEQIHQGLLEEEHDVCDRKTRHGTLQYSIDTMCSDCEATVRATIKIEFHYDDYGSWETDKNKPQWESDPDTPVIDDIQLIHVQQKTDDVGDLPDDNWSFTSGETLSDEDDDDMDMNN